MGFLQSPSIFLEIAFDKLRDFSSQSGVRVLRYKGYAVKPHSFFSHTHAAAKRP